MGRQRVTQIAEATEGITQIAKRSFLIGKANAVHEGLNPSEGTSAHLRSSVLQRVPKLDQLPLKRLHTR